MSDPNPLDEADSTSGKAPADAERQVEVLVEEFLEQCRAGQSLDRAAFVAAHPDLAPWLDRRLALVEMMCRVAQARPGAEAGKQPQPGVPERAIQLRCPHCGNRVQLIEPEPREVTCQNCGSSFQVEPGATADYPSGQLPAIVGKFQVVELLGRGAFGAVYKARDPELDRTVAIKVPRAGYFSTNEEEERFLREARSAARLNHPGIVPIHEIAQNRGVPYIVSDYVEGLTLADRLTGGRPSFRETAELVAAVAEALDYAHRQKVIHRDIKPGNILIDQTGKPHLTDFGLARREEGEITVTLEGQILGTPAYMAPEQALGEGHKVDARSDVYSLGVVLYELLTGELPFRGNKRMLLHQVVHDEPRPPRKLNDGIPRDLETICLKTIAKDPARRYATAAALADDLRRFLNREPIKARPVGRGERLWRWAARNPVVAGLTAAVVLVLLAGTGISLFFAIQASNRAKDALQQKDRADRQAEEAAASARKALARSYVSDMRLAQRAWDDGQIDWLLELLDAQTPQRTGGTDLRGFEWHYWDRLSHSDLPTFKGHTEAVQCVAYSPDGKLLASGGQDQTVKLWDVATGREVRTLKDHPGAVNAMAFSPDGKRLASASEKVVRVWAVSSGRDVLTLKNHAEAVSCVAFSPDSKFLATGIPAPGLVHDGFPGELKVWDAANGREVLALKGQEEWITSVAFSPDGKHLAAGDWGVGVRVWELPVGRLAFTLKGHTDQITSLAYSPDGRRLVSASTDQTVKIWDAATGKEFATLKGHTEPVHCVAFSPDGKLVASASGDSGKIAEVKVWNEAGREKVGLKLRGYDERAASVAFSPDGRRLAVAFGPVVRFMDPAWDGEKIICRGHSGAISSVAFTQDDKRLASASADGTVRIWDAAGGQEILMLGEEDQGVGKRESPAVEGMVFSPRGDWLAAAQGTDVIAWDPASGQKLFTLKGDAGPGADRSELLSSLAISPDARWLATSTSARAPGAPGEITVWLLNSFGLEAGTPLPRAPGLVPGDKGSDHPTPLFTLKGFEAAVTSVTFSPDGTRLASASLDETVKIWTVPDLIALAGSLKAGGADQKALDAALAGKALILTGHTDGVRSVAYSPDGKLLASAGDDRTVCLWDPDTGRQLHVLKGHTAQVNSVAFSPDGKQLASGSGDIERPGEVRVWDVASGQEVLSLKVPPAVAGGGSRPVISVAFSRDGKRLAAGLGPWSRAFGERPFPSQTVHIWDARSLTDDIRREREAVSLYHLVCETLPLKEEIIDRIRQAAGVSDAVRQQALAWAGNFREDPARLRQASWAVVHLPGTAPENYRRALRWAEAASRLEPAKGNYLTTLGVAQYRAGQYEQALATLTRADKLNATDGESVPADLAFLAMTHHRLGHKDQARAYLERLRKLMNNPRVIDWTKDTEAQAFLREAEAVVGPVPHQPP